VHLPTNIQNELIFIAYIFTPTVHRLRNDKSRNRFMKN